MKQKSQKRGMHPVKDFDSKLRKFLLIPRKDERNLARVMNYILE